MKNFFYTALVWYSLLVEQIFAVERMGIGIQPSNSLFSSSSGWTMVQALQFIEGFLLKVVLPLAVVGSGLWIAFELLLAEGDESKNKQAWKAIGYSAIGLIGIMLSYVIVSVISRLSI